MAKDKNKSVIEERIYVIPLRREFLKKPKYQRTKKAVKAVREYIMKHMKIKEVKIGRHLNEMLWERGNRNPPSRVKVKTIIEDVYARVELVDFPFEKKKEPEKKEGLKEKLLGKKEEKTDIQKEEELVKEGKVEQKETRMEKEEEEMDGKSKMDKKQDEALLKEKQKIPRSQKSAHMKKK